MRNDLCPLDMTAWFWVHGADPSLGMLAVTHSVFH
jgi:hypothetical protein